MVRWPETRLSGTSLDGLGRNDVKGNVALAVLTAAMAVFNGLLWVRHRRLYRLAFLAFWCLLFVVHTYRADRLYPAVILALIVAFWLKSRERATYAGLLKPGAPEAAKSTAGGGLWDRELDAHG
jgi:hypothetical protein